MENTQISIKLVVFSVIDGKLRIFLPGKKLLAGDLESGKSLDQSAQNLFRGKTGQIIKDIYTEQLYTFSYIKPSKIAVVYYFLVPEYRIYSNIGNWVEIDNIKSDNTDWEIINYAIQRLRWKIGYTNIVCSLLTPEFTFGELQKAYEAILGKSLDKRNFRKKIMTLAILKNTGHIKKLGKARPAEMFVFRKRKLEYKEVL